MPIYILSLTQGNGDSLFVALHHISHVRVTGTNTVVHMTNGDYYVVNESAEYITGCFRKVTT